MSSETVDWLKKVKADSLNTKSSKLKAKVSFDFEGEYEEESGNFNKKPQANAIYTSKDLTGLKVAHDINSFQAGQSDILVFEDRSVLEEEDEISHEALVSMNLKEEARLKRLREVARHAKGYSGFKAYEEESQEDSFVTLGGSGPKLSGKVLQKYDFASTDYNDEPGVEGFKLGSVKTEEVALPLNQEPHNSNVINDFDTVQSSGIETINNFKKRNGNKTDLEKEQKRARKLAKTLFADDPEMLAEAEPLKSESFKIDFEDDADMQRIIASTRREHLKNITAPLELMENEPKFVGGKSFDALIMSESIFSNKPEETREDGENRNIVEDDAMDNQIESGKIVDSQSVEEDTFAFTQEPLVRNGVASTLALLNMRGINLKPRNISDKGKPGSSDIKLEYFDRFGNKLNTKEAYKELSRKFHGKGAGKDRLEKMKKKREETLKLEAAVSRNDSNIITNLRKQQEESGVPYMLLSGSRHTESSSSEIPEVKQDKKPKIFGLQLKK